MTTENQQRNNLFIPVVKFLDIPKLVFLVFFLILLAFQTPIDPDYYWHLVTGEYILEQQALPSSDIFSYTQYGKPWVLHEWLFQVVLYTAYDWLGQFGVNLITALLALLALYITYTTIKRLSAGPSITVLLSLVFLVFISTFIYPRPQLFTFVLFAIFLSILLGYKYSHNSKHLYFMPLLMVLWVNSHGGYLIGIVLLTLFTLCEWLSYWLLEQPSSNHEKRPTRLTLVAVITALASAANPDFISHWLYPFDVMSMEATKNLIGEWQSPNFLLPLFQGYLLLVTGFFILYIYGNKRPDFTEIIIPVFFILSSFVSVRHMPLAVLTLIPFSAKATSYGLCTNLASWHIPPKLRQLYARSFTNAKQLGIMEYVFNWVILTVIGLAITAYHPIYHSKENEKINSMLPVNATEFIINSGISGKMLNAYHFGGYLLYRLYPEEKVFIDGRADMYGDEFIKEYRNIYTGQHDWEESFDKYDIDYVVCDRNAPIRQLLLARGDFSLVYDGTMNSVLVKNSPQFAAIIKKYGE
jgi:hypothetical protein